MSDRFVFIRTFSGMKVTVVAERLAGDDLYAVQVRRDGELVEHVTSDDVFRDAQQLIRDAFIDALEQTNVAIDLIHVA